jgi:hypothetical protein
MTKFQKAQFDRYAAILDRSVAETGGNKPLDPETRGYLARGMSGLIRSAMRQSDRAQLTGAARAMGLFGHPDFII